MHPHLSRVTTAASSPPAMLLAACGVAYWFVTGETLNDHIDAVLSGGAMLLAQAIYREGEPREIAIHRKLDAIIHGTDADDVWAGIEEKPNGPHAR